jgi:hypothetical protein
VLSVLELLVDDRLEHQSGKETGSNKLLQSTHVQVP